MDDGQLDSKNLELVIGLVYPVGTPREEVLSAIGDRAGAFGYEVNEIRLSRFLANLELGVRLEEAPPAARIESHMTAGNEARRRTGNPEFMTLAAIAEIAKSRRQSPEGARLPLRRVIHLLDSLKRPEEVTALRRVYGDGFLLIGVAASDSLRNIHLRTDLQIVEKDAQRILQRDLEEEQDEYGQRTRDTFHLADAFVALDETNSRAHKDQLYRIVDLLFSNPQHTPTKDEHAMNLAFSAACRSGDLSRQVGATITSRNGDVIAVGCNDVPCPGGGLYWPGDADQRDAARGYDSNQRHRDRIVDEIVDRVRPEASAEAREQAREAVLATSIKDLTEFGRPVHAEMEALLSCARNGISTVGATLYSTTFPCHNCARHIVAAGIERVVYVEPYPKSKAENLHDDAVRF